MDNECPDQQTQGSCHGGHRPAFLAKLPMDRKVLTVAGALIAFLAFLAAVTDWSGFVWLLVIIGGAMAYGGYTGHCLMTHCMKKCCCEKKV